jgi:hypothetical protein
VQEAHKRNPNRASIASISGNAVMRAASVSKKEGRLRGLLGVNGSYAAA